MARGQSSLNSIQIVWMNSSFPDLLRLFQLRQPGILNPASIHKLKDPVGSSKPRHRRDGLNGFAKFYFLPPQSLHSELVQPPKECQKRSHVQQAEPNRLVPGGRDDEVQTRTLFIPDSVVIAGDHVKSVLARRKVRIESLSPCAGALPVGVDAFEF